MPPNEPGSLTPTQTASSLPISLKMNGMPAGRNQSRPTDEQAASRVF